MLHQRRHKPPDLHVSRLHCHLGNHENMHWEAKAKFSWACCQCFSGLALVELHSPTILIGVPREATAEKVPTTHAAPPISARIASMLAEGLSEMPPLKWGTAMKTTTTSGAKHSSPKLLSHWILSWYPAKLLHIVFSQFCSVPFLAEKLRFHTQVLLSGAKWCKASIQICLYFLTRRHTRFYIKNEQLQIF